MATDLDPLHAVGVVLDVLDPVLRQRGEEGRPAAVRVELGLGGEKLGAAGPAAVHANGLRVGVLAGERPLRAGLTQHGVLLGGELLAPLLVALLDCISHDVSLLSVFNRLIQRQVTRVPDMASAATEVDAGGRAVRVSSPDRVIYEATERTPEVTKLQVVEYYVAVGDGIMRALRERPTALERWPKGVREGITLTTRTGEHGDAFYQKRVPKGAPPYVETATIRLPSGRNADEVCPTEIAVPAWAAQMGTLTFHPWPVRRSAPDHPDELRIDLDPHGATGFRDAVRVAGEARRLLDDLGMVGFPKTSGNRGVHVYVRIEPRWDFVDVRHAAIGFGRELERRTAGVTTKWWKEERGDSIFVDYNQNARDRTIASAYSLRPKPGAPVSTPVEWDELGEVEDPAQFNLFTVPERFAERGDVHARINDVHNSLEPLLALFEEQGAVELPYPPDYPKMPGEPPRVQPSKKNAANWAAD